MTTAELPTIVYQPCSIIEKAPDPAAPCQELLPWEKYEQEERLEEQKRLRKTREAEENRLVEEKKGGIDSLVAKANEVATKISVGVSEGIEKMERGLRSELYAAQRNRFEKNIGIIQPDFPKEEVLWFEYTCYSLSGNVPVGGLLYISDNYVSFFHQLGDGVMKVMIPLISIVSIHHAVSLPLQNSEHPFLQQVLNQNVKFDGILIYTDDQKVHSFYDFRAVHDPITPIPEHAWNVLDHAWRKAKNFEI